MKPIVPLIVLFASAIANVSPIRAQQFAQVTTPVAISDPMPKAQVEQFLSNLEKLNPKLKERKLFEKLQEHYGMHDSYPLQNVLALTAAETAEAAKDPVVPEPSAIPRERAKQYFEVLESLDSKKEGLNLFRQLREAFKDKDTYTADQVLYIAKPDAFLEKVERPPHRPTTELLPGTYSKDQVEEYFKAQIELDKAQKKSPVDRMDILKDRYGDRPEYLAKEIREVDGNPDPKKMKVVSNRLTKKGSDLKRERLLNTGRSPFWQGLSGLKIRKDWSDVVAGEDPSQTDKKNDMKSLDDLEGAKLSFSHDEQAKPFNGSTVANTWSANGSVIYPFTWRSDESGGWVPDWVTLAPSVSINRVSTENPTNQVDHFQYRVGVIGNWIITKDWGLSEVQARGAFVYATDVGHSASLPAGELDLEPKFLWKQNRTRGKQWGGIGYRNILIEKEPRKADDSDRSILDWQLRTWLHLEGGDLQRNGASWDVASGSFFRVGPAFQAVVNFPTLLKGFSINGQYNYLQAVSGPTNHRNYWKAGGALTVYHNPALKHKISLTADYQRLVLSKQAVDITTVGLGVTF